MAAEIDELTVDYYEGDQQLVKQLDKVVLSKGSWVTIIYRYQDWEAAKGAFSADKFTIRRYQKRNGEYFQKSKFNISSVEQAQKIISALQNWISDKS
jgi:hypothetical protein